MLWLGATNKFHTVKETLYDDVMGCLHSRPGHSPVLQ